MRRIKKLLKVLFRMVFSPSLLGVLIRNFLKKRLFTKEDRLHLDETMLWLSRSQDVLSGKGCAGLYTYEYGWSKPYPETTGYIIPTFIDYSEFANNPLFLDRAKELGDWEIEIQLTSGAVRGGVGINEYPIVFNTGQVLQGWVVLFERTNEQKYLQAAILAGDWLINNQDPDGNWTQNTYCGIPHAYNIRVAWALFQLFGTTRIEKYKEAADKNLRWTISQANDEGWIRHMSFNLEPYVFTHTIAYTLEGLLECSKYADENLKGVIIDIVRKASIQMINSHEKGGRKCVFIAGAYNENWKPDLSYSCLTGNAQLAIIWISMHNLTGDKLFLEKALQLVSELKMTQDLTSSNPGIKGGIQGSYPIWGKYSNFSYPNWAAKYFADLLMIKIRSRL